MNGAPPPRSQAIRLSPRPSAPRVRICVGGYSGPVRTMKTSFAPSGDNCALDLVSASASVAPVFGHAARCRTASEAGPWRFALPVGRHGCRPAGCRARRDEYALRLPRRRVLFHRGGVASGLRLSRSAAAGPAAELADARPGAGFAARVAAAVGARGSNDDGTVGPGRARARRLATGAADCGCVYGGVGVRARNQPPHEHHDLRPAQHDRVPVARDQGTRTAKWRVAACRRPRCRDRLRGEATGWTGRGRRCACARRGGPALAAAKLVDGGRRAPGGAAGRAVPDLAAAARLASGDRRQAHRRAGRGRPGGLHPLPDRDGERVPRPGLGCRAARPVSAGGDAFLAGSAADLAWGLALVYPASATARRTTWRASIRSCSGWARCPPPSGRCEDA